MTTSRRSLITRLIAAGGLAGTIGGSAAASAAAAVSPQRKSSQPVAEIESGKLLGAASADGLAFLGIPYAAAVSGRQRYLPPRPAVPWAGIRDATAYGPICPQENVAEKVRYFTAGGFPGTIPNHPQPLDEDCLQLNVWTADLTRQKKRPVMVWLHGGSFIGGSANALWYEGARLASRGDVVVVGVNHRVGSLGFLHLEELLGAEFAASGLNGMLDIVAALGWIRRNIETFGGDPTRVTVFGESGGGMKVTALLGMPTAKGLFHRGIIQSGAGIRGQSRDDAARVTALMLAELGLDAARISTDTLQTVPIDQLIAAQQRLVKKVRGGALRGVTLEFRPVIHEQLLPAHPFDPVAPSVSADVPVIVGTNEMDASWGLWRDPDWDTMTEPRLLERLRTELGDKGVAAAQLYARLYPLDTPIHRYVRIRSRATLSISLAERKADIGRAPCFMYLFAWNTPQYGGRVRSPHMLDVPFAFNTVHHTEDFTGTGPKVEALATAMSSAWVGFARDGVPAAPAWPLWRPYSRESRHTLVISDTTVLAADPDREAREFWMG